LQQFHTAADRVLPAKSLQYLSLFSIRRTTFPCGRACEIAEQDFPRRLVLVSDKAEPEQKAAESVVLVLHIIFGGYDTFLPFDHIHKGCNACGVGGSLIALAAPP